MMLPKIFGESLLDNWNTDDGLMNPGFFGRSPVNTALYGKNGSEMMKTDIKEKDDCYEIMIDLPGFKKDEVKLSLDRGYIVVKAEKELKKDEKDEDGRYIRHERYSGSCTRSFYVGNTVKHDEIKAKLEDGTLTVELPKKDAAAADESDKFIEIEG